MSIVLIVDFAQLPPVGDRLLFSHPTLTDSDSSDHAYLLYKQFTTVVKLKQILRQDTSTANFKELLYNLRDGNVNHDMWQTLLTRCPAKVSNTSQFNNATHLFFDKQSVAQCNHKHLEALGNTIAKIESINSDHTAQVTTADDAGGLDSVIFLSKHAKVMLTSNPWQQTGLCNGTTGQVL